MPRRVVDIEVEVPSRHRHRLTGGGLDNPDEALDEAQRSGSGRSSRAADRKARRFSPYGNNSAKSVPDATTSAVVPGPATRLAEQVDGLGLAGPVSSRTRTQRLKGFQEQRGDGPSPDEAPRDVPVPTRTRIGGWSSAPATVGAAGSSSDPMPALGGGPMARQQQKEDRWRSKLERQRTSWWDSASIGVAQGMEEGGQQPEQQHASLAALSRANSQGQLRTLARGRNHARAEARNIDAWRDAAVDGFLERRPPHQETVEEQADAEPESATNFSPGHFDRHYRARPLKPLKPIPRSKPGAGGRELRNVEARTRVFVGARGA